MRYVAALAALSLLAGCAAPEHRYLTIEEDQHLREVCEPQGCVAVPAPLLDHILKMLPKTEGA